MLRSDVIVAHLRYKVKIIHRLLLQLHTLSITGQHELEPAVEMEDIYVMNNKGSHLCVGQFAHSVRVEAFYVAVLFLV